MSWFIFSEVSVHGWLAACGEAAHPGGIMRQNKGAHLTVETKRKGPGSYHLFPGYSPMTYPPTTSSREWHAWDQVFNTWAFGDIPDPN
jgi:hypothetical protein